MHRCLNCKINLCPLCRNSHNKSHDIIKYEQKNFICQYDNDCFSCYCQNCKQHCCISCESEHEGHKIIQFNKIIPKKSELKNGLDVLKKNIDDFSEECEEIIRVINIVKNNLNLIYNIQKNMVDNFDIKSQKNYYIFSNLNKIFNNNKIIQDINNIKNEVSLENKFSYIISIYNDMHNTKETNKK